MLQLTRLEMTTEGNETLLPNEAGLDPEAVRHDALALAQALAWVANVPSSTIFAERSRALAAKLTPVLRRVSTSPEQDDLSGDFRWLHDNLNILISELESARDSLKSVHKTPHVRTAAGVVMPRVLAIAEGMLRSCEYRFRESVFSSYVASFQDCTVLDMKELWLLISAIKLVLLEQVAARAVRCLEDPGKPQNVGVCIHSLHEVRGIPWKDAIEPLIVFDEILRKDPADTYRRMDFSSRELYRSKVVDIAERSDLTEQEVALAALALAQDAQRETYAHAREANRRCHIGYYLVAEGVSRLWQRVDFRPRPGQRIEFTLKKQPNEFYLSAIAGLTLAIMSTVVWLLTAPYTSPAMVVFTMLVLLLPCSQSAVQVTNYLIASLLKPQILPKLDLAKGLPDDCVTLVAVPTLLLTEEQVRRLVDDLEVRFLGNHDRNLHFALLTDLPDSSVPAREDDPLVDLCASLIRDLNLKYANQESGSFFLLHRHRVYNPGERTWMGWERKRGKLLDLNKLLRQRYDSFPVKVGDLSVLPRVRFVITLDADTELPRTSAHRMVGTLAHPLNQAIIDHESNTVVAGYGILQPRVGVNIQSAARSRLAKIYSGQTGLDIYTRAVSDIYQDLYGEGTFAGKGIYEVDVLQQVLDARFPRNALLSHDLIEGAYARAGLVTDIEIIEGYPSHYSAYNRRKHRWLRGDWQIVEWLTARVPGESRNRVANPISLLSQWKILDNLRRSLVEPATFLLLVLGWTVLPGSARNWTLATIAILFVPSWCRASFEMTRAVFERKAGIARDALASLFAANINVLLSLTFLAHQMLLSLDAMVRVLVRRVTRLHLLQWETAAEAEVGAQRPTPLDIYLEWTPVLSLGIALLLYLVRRSALPVALPILLLWACSRVVSIWLNLPPRAPRKQVSQRERIFLRTTALRTWRYFAEFSTEEHNWLIPDNVVEENCVVAARVSPTNLGLLLNARQVACKLGYLTVPEFSELTRHTLETLAKLQRFRGHLLNWYDTRTLEPLPHPFVSSVDNGNLAASLWTLKQGCLEQLREPLWQTSAADGFLDYSRILMQRRVLSRAAFSDCKRAMRSPEWLQWLLDRPEASFAVAEKKLSSEHADDARWFAAETAKRLANFKEVVRRYTPWLLPEFRTLRDNGVIAQIENTALQRLPEFIDNLATQLSSSSAHALSGDQRLLSQQLLSLLPEARQQSLVLIENLRQLASEANRLADEMDFSILLSPQRKLLSIGFNVDEDKLESSCYDLLASEARMAVFVAIAKDEIPQDTWFSLGRIHILDHGRPVLRSWTGTMFEYLMPSIWMHVYPDTLLERSRSAAVRAQRAYTAHRHIPWGISESAHAKKDDAGNYGYFAFGIPRLALRKEDTKSLVISPYSTFLALQVDPVAALQNLRAMEHLGWVGPYGFYESADFTASTWRHRCELVRCWMAHHQGMTLLSIANFLCDDLVQRWFHKEPQVQATELLLQEKPVAYVRPPLEKYGATAA